MITTVITLVLLIIYLAVGTAVLKQFEHYLSDDDPVLIYLTFWPIIVALIWGELLQAKLREHLQKK